MSWFDAFSDLFGGDYGVDPMEYVSGTGGYSQPDIQAIEGGTPLTDLASSYGTLPDINDMNTISGNMGGMDNFGPGGLPEAPTTNVAFDTNTDIFPGNIFTGQNATSPEIAPAAAPVAQAGGAVDMNNAPATVGGTGGIKPMNEFMSGDLTNGSSSSTDSSFMDGAKSLGGQAFDLIKGNPGKMALLAGGMLSNFAGNTLNNDAQKKGQQDYLSAVTWTPDKVANYTNALRSNASSVFGNQEANTNKAMAASNATKGRGGGTYGNTARLADINMRNQLAGALNQGAMTTSAPSNVSYGAFQNSSPLGDTLTGIGGMAGSTLKTLSTLELLKQLGINN